MAFRPPTRFLNFLRFRSHLQKHPRLIHTQSEFGAKRSLRPLLLGAVAIGAGLYGVRRINGPMAVLEGESLLGPTTVSAASLPASQPSVYSQGKDHAVYLWVHLNPSANVREVARAVAKLQKYVDQVTDPSTKDETDEIWAGVGFGPNFYKQVGGKVQKNFHYPHRKGQHGEMLSTGGDIFIHAKCNTMSKLFELVQLVMKTMPHGSVKCFEDVYSFVYKNGRDLSGFIDGTENPADEDDRCAVAVEQETGGSYVITQKWIHDLGIIDNEKDKTLEGWIGRSRPDSMELSRKSISSHVARMTGGTPMSQKKMFEIVRQSMPFGTVSGEAGLFFIGYAASPENFEYMLDRMVGSVEDGHSDDIMRFSKNVRGTYWYFPGVSELKKLE